MTFYIPLEHLDTSYIDCSEGPQPLQDVVLNYNYHHLGQTGDTPLPYQFTPQVAIAPYYNDSRIVNNTDYYFEQEQTQCDDMQHQVQDKTTQPQPPLPAPTPPIHFIPRPLGAYCETSTQCMSPTEYYLHYTWGASATRLERVCVENRCVAPHMLEVNSTFVSRALLRDMLRTQHESQQDFFLLYTGEIIHPDHTGLSHFALFMVIVSVVVIILFVIIFVSALLLRFRYTKRRHEQEKEALVYQINSRGHYFSLDWWWWEW